MIKKTYAKKLAIELMKTDTYFNQYFKKNEISRFAFSQWLVTNFPLPDIKYAIMRLDKPQLHKLWEYMKWKYL